MATQNTQVCCCGAATWTFVFAWLQIVGAVLGIIGVSVFLAAGAVDDDKIDEDKRTVIKIALIVVLVLLIAEFVVGMVLLIGNQREKLGLLWTWLNITGVCAAVVVISGIVSLTTGNVGSLVLTVISTAISVFMINVVHQRIQDIKMGSAVSSEV